MPFAWGCTHENRSAEQQEAVIEELTAAPVAAVSVPRDAWRVCAPESSQQSPGIGDMNTQGPGR